jgi:cell division inhibitor SepF
MAGAIRRMATYLGLVEDDQYYTDQPGARPDDRVAVSEHGSDQGETRQPYQATVHELTPAWQRPGYRIPIVQPATYNDARRIGEEFRHGSPVIMDLTGMSDTDAKRIVDFAAGLVFGLHGAIERLTPKVFLLSPDTVDVTDIARSQIDEQFFPRG